jgi:hypothetical protein
MSGKGLTVAIMTFTEKSLRSRPAIRLAGRAVKRYHVFSDTAVIEPAIEQAAHRILPALLPEPDGTPAATFIVLHRGSDGAAYLNAYSWVWDNVLHMRGAAAGQPALDCPDDDPTNFIVVDRPWIGCVYELPPLGHERDAWVRHMLAPEVPDLAGYLADTLPGAR